MYLHVACWFHIIFPRLRDWHPTSEEDAYTFLTGWAKGILRRQPRPVYAFLQHRPANVDCFHRQSGAKSHAAHLDSWLFVPAIAVAYFKEQLQVSTRYCASCTWSKPCCCKPTSTHPSFPGRRHCCAGRRLWRGAWQVHFATHVDILQQVNFWFVCMFMFWYVHYVNLFSTCPLRSTTLNFCLINEAVSPGYVNMLQAKKKHHSFNHDSCLCDNTFWNTVQYVETWK